MSGCLFCDLQVLDPKRVIAQNDLAYVVRDGYPVSKHHTLFIPTRHVEDYFGLTDAEVIAIHALMHAQKIAIERLDGSVEGLNIGMNCGQVAGQTVFHCHVHLIPRRTGDVSTPRGGVRHIFPGKAIY